MPEICYLDTETRSATPIQRGNDLYTRDAKCMIVTYALDDAPTKLWEPWKDPLVPRDLWEAVHDRGCRFIAHNAGFDRAILARCLGLMLPFKPNFAVFGDVSRWRCTMAQASSHGLPGSLELLGTVLGLSEDQGKLVDDKSLIQTFCVPQGGRFIEPPELPADWTRFCNYAVRDTDALREIYKRLPKHNYSDFNLQCWWLDQLINERGFQFDAPFARAAVEFLGDAKVTADANMHQLTDGEVHAATQRNRLLKFLRDRLEIPIESLRAADVRDWLEHDDLDPVVRLLLEQRLEASKSSGSKYNRGLAMVGPRNRLRGTIRFNGAGRTGRDSHRGFQPGNMARPQLVVRRESGRIELTPVKANYIDEVVMPGIYSKQALVNPEVYGGPHEAAALTMRHTITAAEGNELVVGDWKNIESVITGWCADEREEVEAFRAAFEDPKNKALDVYRKQWAGMFHMDPLAVNDTQRQGGKVVKLAFGFHGGVGALVTMAAGYQMDLEPLVDAVMPYATEQQKAKAYKAWRRAFLTNEDYDLDPKVYQACDILKQAYRATNSKIDQFAKDVDTATKEAIANPNSYVANVGRCRIWSTGSYLIIQLPSGRRLLYADPKIETQVKLDPEGGKPWITQNITYCTARGRSWRRERAWSGLFVENIVQAIAADIKRAKSMAVHLDALTVPAVAAYLAQLPAGERTPLVLMVHDELVLDVPVGSYPKERLARVMCAPIDWAPGLPLAADVWSNFRYGKR